MLLEIIRHDKNELKTSFSESKEYALTLKQYSQHHVDFDEINKLCHEIYSILNKPIFEDAVALTKLQKAGQALWDNLLPRSAKEKLKSPQSLDLGLLIDEELISIPWELLYDGTNFLCLKFNLGRLVRTKTKGAPLQYRFFSHAVKMLILANPTNDLKCAYQEGVNIRNQFENKRLGLHVDFKSTNIDKLYVKKNLCDYDIIHFAGHCEYERLNSRDSGWVLNGGRFSVNDILSMGQAASLPAMVFSNACNSALVDSIESIESDYQENRYSLAAAFLFSGVRHYIGAIRKIEDTASLRYAKIFYSHLTSGKSVGESARLSRIALVRDFGVISLHWTNYLLYGDPSFILFKPKVKIKPKNKITINLIRKWLLGTLVVAVVIGLCIYLYALLPTGNPNAYRLFLKSQRLYSSGQNKQVIDLSQDIIKKDPDFADAYRLLADTYFRLGDKENALKNYFAYALIAEKRHDFKRLANAYIEIGWFYQLNGEYPKAFSFYNKALGVSRKHADKLNEAIAMRKLAVWHIDKKEYDAALALLIKSSEINRERQYLYEHRYNLACDYFDIGLLFSDKDDLIAAHEFYRKSKVIFEKLKAKYELSDYYFNLGELYLFEKQYQKALDYYLAGLAVDLSLGSKFNLCSDYTMLGELYMEMDRIIEAEDAFNKAAELAREIKLQPDLAVALYDLGLLYKKIGKKNKAAEFLRQAEEIYSRIDPLSYNEVKNEILGLNK